MSARISFLSLMPLQNMGCPICQISLGTLNSHLVFLFLGHVGQPKCNGLHHLTFIGQFEPDKKTVTRNFGSAVILLNQLCESDFKTSSALRAVLSLGSGVSRYNRQLCIKTFSNRLLLACKSNQQMALINICLLILENCLFFFYEV